MMANFKIGLNLISVKAHVKDLELSTSSHGLRTEEFDTGFLGLKLSNDRTIETPNFKPKSSFMSQKFSDKFYDQPFEREPKILNLPSPFRTFYHPKKKEKINEKVLLEQRIKDVMKRAVMKMKLVDLMIRSGIGDEK